MTSSVLACPEGSYGSRNASVCPKCEEGYRCTGGLRYQCPDNQYSEIGKSSCNWCLPGFSCVSGEKKPCDVGNYCPGWSAMTQCQAG